MAKNHFLSKYIALPDYVVGNGELLLVGEGHDGHHLLVDEGGSQIFTEVGEKEFVLIRMLCLIACLYGHF